ncbi:hypothetical protein BT93_E2151 [Corymbia citriodora subsp. variegata]|nr:hypothetical protein BT93_E2151 [Corymbia citriodora subsp. variegata]
MSSTVDDSSVSSSTTDLKQPATTMSVQPPSIPLLLRLPSVLLCLHILALGLSDAQHCYDTGNFTAASSYAKNRELVFSSLPSIMASNGGFYSGKSGNGSDVVYVLSFCRGDSSNDTCIKCISTTAEDLMIKCPNQKAAFSKGTYNPPCFIRYSDSPMYGVKETFPTLKFYRVGDIPMDQDQFDRIWRNLTEALAVRASMGTLELKFAAGSTVLPNSQTMYTLLQCSPDLSQGDCQSCLGECINDYQGCCHGRLGGSIYKPSCIFRWELYPFLESNPGNPLPSSPPSTAAGETPSAPPPLNAQVTSDSIKRTLLSWERRLSIIRGIARGLLYLHEESCLRIVHRDMKPSNVLLDENMNPKISDFGTARLFGLDQSRENTSQIAGTFGYMAPEYVKHGEISGKIDVYSFGVVVLEIVSGKKNSCLSSSGNLEHLLDYNVGRRPTMASVVLMLESQSTTLPMPTRPAYLTDANGREMSTSSAHRSSPTSINEASITDPHPR